MSHFNSSSTISGGTGKRTSWSSCSLPNLASTSAQRLASRRMWDNLAPVS
ncbi:hypothetical protein LguiB_003665 [Lonicera macranthoides]